MRWRSVAFLCVALALLAPALLGACGGAGDQKTVKGQVTAVDAGARTFSVRGNDGKTYDFKMVAGSKGDLAELKEHLDLKKEVEVTYRGSAAPYEVVNAD